MHIGGSSAPPHLRVKIKERAEIGIDVHVDGCRQRAQPRSGFEVLAAPLVLGDFRAKIKAGVGMERAAGVEQFHFARTSKLPCNVELIWMCDSRKMFRINNSVM